MEVAPYPRLDQHAFRRIAAAKLGRTANTLFLFVQFVSFVVPLL
jgi:hypothetical protein